MYSNEMSSVIACTHAGLESNRTTIFPLLNSPLSSVALLIFLTGCVYMYRVSQLSATLRLRSYSC